jgi:hypothetical protein
LQNTDQDQDLADLFEIVFHGSLIFNVYQTGSFLVVQIENVPIDENKERIFVDLPVCIPSCIGEQEKDQTHGHIQQVWAYFLHGNLVMEGL